MSQHTPAPTPSAVMAPPAVLAPSAVTTLPPANPRRREALPAARHADAPHDDPAEVPQLSVMRQLLDAVTSDFNGLLTTIEAGHDLVSGYAADERIARVIEVGKRATRRSRKLIAQVQPFSRRRVAPPGPCNMRDVVAALDGLIQCAAGEAIRLKWRLQPALPNVVIDPARFQATVLGLVFAARDSMPDGGELTVFMEAMAIAEDDPAAPPGCAAGNYVVFGLGRAGTAVPAAAAARLMPCHRFARQAGGALAVESSVADGTTLRLLLPALAAAAEGWRGRTVLLVEDDTCVLSLVGEMLTNMGHRVVGAQDARDALDRLREDATIDCLFTDIVMPNGMNGMQLMQAARAARPGLATLLTSAYSREEVGGMGEIPPDVAFFAKPYSLADVGEYLCAA